MARALRLEFEGALYHLCARGLVRKNERCLCSNVSHSFCLLIQSRLSLPSRSYRERLRFSTSCTRKLIGDDYETAHRNHCACSAGSARDFRGRAVIAGARYGLLGQRRCWFHPESIDRPATTNRRLLGRYTAHSLWQQTD